MSSFCSFESKSSQPVLLLASVAQQQSSKRISAKHTCGKALVPTLKRLTESFMLGCATGFRKKNVLQKTRDSTCARDDIFPHERANCSS